MMGGNIYQMTEVVCADKDMNSRPKNKQYVKTNQSQDIEVHKSPIKKAHKLHNIRENFGTIDADPAILFPDYFPMYLNSEQKQKRPFDISRLEKLEHYENGGGVSVICESEQNQDEDGDKSEQEGKKYDTGDPAQ